MSQKEVVMVVECDEPEGVVVREVRPLYLTVDKLNGLYEKLKEFDVLFNDHVGNDLESFLNAFLTEVNGEMQSTGLLWEVDDVGILYLTDIRPGYDAYAHFSFWDRRFRGREDLVRQMIRYVIKKFGFHRITVDVPKYAAPTMGFVERIGFIKEGVRRKVVKYKGEWFDAIQYAIVESDHVMDDSYPLREEDIPKHLGREA